MQEIFSITAEAPKTLSDTMELLQQAATGHSYDLNIHFDRMLEEFHCLWMIVRGKVHLDRMPKGQIRIDTWLRKPSSVVSIRDYSILEGDEEIGYGIYSWALVSAEERKLINMRSITPVLDAPTRSPERQGAVKRINLPDGMEHKADWLVLPEEIDKNGHVNNVRYIRHAEPLFPHCTDLEVIYDRECFVGENIRLLAKDGYVQGVKESGEECFRVKFWRDL